MVLSTHIPLDIIGNIVNEFLDDSRTLKVVSIVSRSFLSFSQRQLFAKINLKISYRNSEDRERAHRLQSIFAINPTLALYVRDFSLDIRDLWHPQTMTYPQSIRLSDYVLPDILEGLQLARCFSLSGLWNPQTPTWKSAVLKLCRSPNLNHLHLSGIEHFPMSEIPHFRQLRRLSLSDTSLKIGEPNGTSPRTPVEIGDGDCWLDVLEFDIESTGIQELWEMMMQPEAHLRVSRLRTLRLAGTNSMMRKGVWEIFQAVSCSLECLIWEHTFVPVIDLLIDSNHWAPYDMGPMNFGILQNLRFIAFSFTLNGPITTSNTRIRWILNCLQYMGSHRNKLEEVVFTLFPNPTTPVTFSLDEWTTSLDSILSSGGFPALQNLSIHLQTPHSDFPFPSNMVALVADQFPLLRSASKLSVKSSHECVHIPLFEYLITKIARVSRQ